MTATLGNSTAYDQRSVTNFALPGTSALDVTDPSGDDNGPGTYQYPTSSSFTAGAFDLTKFKVNQDASNVYLQATIRNLAPTFGSDFGAQLLDVYVRNPGAGTTSTAAAASSLNYSIASGSAWSSRIEAQAFRPTVWVDSGGASLGSPPMFVDDSSDTVTLVFPKSTFGTVGSGWVFTVALTGQDGFSSDQARGFTTTPGAFTFGVCSSGGGSPICSFDPSMVPKVMDTITPSGVSQSTELDPTLGPVVLRGVSAS